MNPTAPGWLAASDDHAIEALVAEHYRRNWGKPAQTTRYPAPDPLGTLLIAGYHLQTEQWSSWVYATVGMCRQPMPVAARAHSPQRTTDGR